ncbi:TonB-dependent receptor [Ilyomonas limi]|uniref:TonB-dependent receptor n=1 Tax=Ilyomonas limi TaxID=2575867 RepID=A0A4U3L0S4_9BACT|nr:TonB-dependent receptor [Ilyomonas limi]TKK68342.1 TonB-dependent receptor [Ilyomonas limi]
MNLFLKRLRERGKLSALLTVLLLLTVTAIAAAPIKGVITDASGKPLEGVTVTVKGTTSATMTSSDGTFTIDAGTGAVLVISSVGFESLEVPMTTGKNMTIVLKEKVNTMDEVIVIGYGSQQKKDLTGAIASVSEKDIEKTAITTPDQALKGKVAGVQVHTNSHAPGGGISVQIRGTASISAGGSPLYVIDGMPISNDFITGRSTDVGSFGAPPNPLNSIDPSEIASIQVLKDASATAIYGSRAANGVVLITTKRGQSGQQTTTAEYTYGIAKLSNKLPFLNAQQWAEQANERAVLLGQAKVYSDQEVANFGQGTDWQDEVYRTAARKEYKLSFSGGNAGIRYLVAGNIADQDGIVTGSNFKRYGATINVDANVSKNFKIGESLIYSITNNKIVPTDTKGYEGISNVIDAIYEAPPTIPARDSAGNPIVLANYPLGGGRENPLVMTDKYKQLTNTGRLIGNVYGNYTIIKGLDLNVRFGVDVNDWRYHEYYPIGSEAAAGAGGKASQTSMKNTNFSNANTLTYQTSINDNQRITILGGFTYQKNTNEVLSASSFGFPSDIFQYYNLGLGSSVQTPGSNFTEWTLISYLGRVNYSLLNRYLVTASVRADGDSKFGKNNKYGVFPSVSFAWQLGEEGFIKRMNIFNQLKLRTSYGKTGNEAIGVYRSLSLLGTSYGTRSSYIYGTTRYPIAYPQNLANPDLSWEKTSEYNVGLDMGIIKGRVSLSIDYYYKKTTDLLLDVPVPSQTGFGGVLQNTGAMLNKGVEIGLNSTNFTGKFNWNTNFNISFNKNKILSLGGAPYIYTGWVGGGNVTPHDKNTARLQPGHSVGEFYGSVYEGIWTSQEEIDKVGTMPAAKPGDIRYKDVNGDGIYDTENDDVFLGNPNPKFNFGFTNEFSYKNWSLHVFMYGEYGNKVLNLAAQQLALDGLGPSAKRLDRWSPDNLDGKYPSAAFSNPQRVSSILVEDGSFLRIQTVALAYNLPVKNLFSGKVIHSARLAVSADNLAVFTKYSGYDPEVNSYGTSNTSKGMDRFGYPPSRIINFSIALTL